MKKIICFICALYIILPLFALGEAPFDELSGSVSYDAREVSLAELLPEHTAPFIESPESITLENIAIGAFSEPPCTASDSAAIQTIMALLSAAIPIDQAPSYTLSNSETRNRITLSAPGQEDYYVDVCWSSWRFPEVYLLKPDGFYTLPESASTFLQALHAALLHETYDTAFSSEHASFLNQYRLMIDWKQGASVETVPASLQIDLSDERTLYWAFAQKLLQSAGMDLTPYAGETIDVFFYQVHFQGWDTIPDAYNPRCILFAKDQQIIGAYLCETNDHFTAWNPLLVSFETLCQNDINAWMAQEMIPSQRLAEISALSAEQALYAYLQASIDDDVETMLAIREPQGSLHTMLYMMGEEFKLYTLYAQRDARPDSLHNMLEILSVEAFDIAEAAKNVYDVRVRYEENNFDPPAGTAVSRYYVMEQLPGIEGWKLTAINTGM